MNEKIMKQAGFDKEVELVKTSRCPFCEQVVNVNELKDEISKKEFKISGLCQKCQYYMFG